MKSDCIYLFWVLNTCFNYMSWPLCGRYSHRTFRRHVVFMFVAAVSGPKALSKGPLDSQRRPFIVKLSVGAVVSDRLLRR